MTSPLHSFSSHLIRRWKHIDPPGLWSSVFTGSAIVHLLVLGFTSRISIEPTSTDPDLVAVDLVELPLENIPPAPTSTEPTIQPPIPTQPTTPNPPTQNPTTPNPPTRSPSGNFPSASPTPPVGQPTPTSPTPSIPENQIDSSTPPEEQPTEQPTEPPAEPSPTPTPDPSPNPTPEEVPQPLQENPNPATPTPNPTTPAPSGEPTEPNQPSDNNNGNSSGDSSEPTTTDSVRVTLASVTGVAAYEESCASSANGNVTICLGNSIVSPSPNGQCNGQFSIEALIDDSVSPSRGTILQVNEVRQANGGNALASCSTWLENLIRDWRFQPGETSEYFTSALIEISIAIDAP